MSAGNEPSILIQLQSQGHAVEHVRLRALEEDGDDRAERSGRYDVLGPIAEGRVGMILKARDIDLGRDVALKVLHERHLDDPESVRRLVEEAQIGGQLQHPGIVDVYEIGLQEDRKPFFAMRFVKGSTLAERLLERADGDDRTLLRVFERFARALAYAHARGVVHRDLKPANVMVGAFGEVQILDWGLACILPRGGVADERRSQQPELTMIATARSTSEPGDDGRASLAAGHAYMAPEQALGHDQQLDERCDVFALGAVLCEILTGAPPYVGDPEQVRAAARRAQLDDAFARLDACEAEAALKTLARSCLEPLRKDRPRNAGDVADGVAGWLDALAERATRSRVRAAQDRAARERSEEKASEVRLARRQGILVGLCVVAALLVGGVSFLWLRRGEADRTQRAAAAVSGAIDQAVRLAEEGAHERARVAAEQAVELAGVEGVSAERRQRAADVLAGTVAEHERASAEAARKAADRKLLDTLVEARFRWGDELDPAETDAYFADAFRVWGVDVEQDEPAAVAAKLRGRGRDFALESAAALAEWSWLRRVKLEQEQHPWRALLDLADRVDPDDARRRLRRADVELDREGLRALAKDAEPHPDTISDLSRIAAALQPHGYGKDAEALLRRLWLEKPEDVWVCYRLGNVLQLRKPHEAVAFYEAALALRPESLEVRHRMGIALHYAGRREEAIGLFRDCMAMHADHGHLHAHIAQAQLLQGRIDEALASARKAVELDPDDAFAAYMHSAMLDCGGNMEASLRESRRATAAKPKWSGGPWQVGVQLGRLGRVQEGIDAWADYLERYRPWQRDWAEMNMGSSLFSEGDYAHAEEAMAIAVRDHPEQFLAHFNMGTIRFHRGDLAGSEAAYRTALSLEQAGSEALRAQAANWVQALKRAVALEPRLDELARTPPEDREARLHAGLACAGRGRHLDAARLFQGAVEPEERDRWAGKGLAWRVLAARCATSAGCGRGQGASDLNVSERAALGSRARYWLENELQRQSVLAASDGAGVAARLDRWMGHIDFRPVFWDRELRKLPEEEQEAWRNFWKAVEFVYSEAKKRS